MFERLRLRNAFGSDIFSSDAATGEDVIIAIRENLADSGLVTGGGL